jgi:hypothetical protein
MILRVAKVASVNLDWSVCTNFKEVLPPRDRDQEDEDEEDEEDEEEEGLDDKRADMLDPDED